MSRYIGLSGRIQDERIVGQLATVEHPDGFSLDDNLADGDDLAVVAVDAAQSMRSVQERSPSIVVKGGVHRVRRSPTPSRESVGEDTGCLLYRNAQSRRKEGRRRERRAISRTPTACCCRSWPAAYG